MLWVVASLLLANTFLLLLVDFAAKYFLPELQPSCQPVKHSKETEFNITLQGFFAGTQAIQSPSSSSSWRSSPPFS